MLTKQISQKKISLNLVQVSSIIIFIAQPAVAHIKLFYLNRPGNTPDLREFCKHRGFNFAVRSNPNPRVTAPLNQRLITETPYSSKSQTWARKKNPYVICSSQLEPKSEKEALELANPSEINHPEPLEQNEPLNEIENPFLSSTPPSTEDQAPLKSELSPPQHFASSLKNLDNPVPLPIVNDLNRAYFEANPTLKRDYQNLTLPINQLLSREQCKSQTEMSEGSSKNQNHEAQTVALFEQIFTQLSAKIESDSAHKGIGRETINFLKDEFEILIHSNKSIPNDWAMLALARFLAAQANPSEEEIDIFNHVLSEKKYSEFFKNDRWKKEDDFRSHLDAVLEQKEASTRTSAWEEFIDPQRIKQLLYDHSLMPKRRYFLVFGQRFVNPLFICSSFLHHIFPLGVSHEESSPGAHGLSPYGATPFGFYLHDLYHAHQFFNQNLIEQNILLHIQSLPQTSEFSEGFIISYLPIALKRYQGLLNLFQVILDAAMAQNHPDLKAIAAGFFQGIHEHMALHPRMLDEPSPYWIIKSFTASIKKSIRHPLSWVAPYDPLYTEAASTGQSSLSEEEMLEVLKREITSGYLGPACPSQEKTTTAQRRSKFVESENCVLSKTSSNRFINIELSHKRRPPFVEDKISIELATLFHKLTNAEDHFKLLKYANGIDSNFQSLHDRAFANPSDYKTVILYLNKLELNLINCVEKYEKFAQTVVAETNAEGHSIQNDYLDWSQSLAEPRKVYREVIEQEKLVLFRRSPTFRKIPWVGTFDL